MSEYIFNLPDLGEGLVEAEIAEWMVKVGDLVQEEDPIGAMLTDNLYAIGALILTVLYRIATTVKRDASGGMAARSAAST